MYYSYTSARLPCFQLKRKRSNPLKNRHKSWEKPKKYGHLTQILYTSEIYYKTQGIDTELTLGTRCGVCREEFFYFFMQKNHNWVLTLIATW